MADFATRMEAEIHKHIDETADRMGENLVINRQMPNDDVHWHRGYIACLRDMDVFIKKELKKKLNEG